MIAIYFCFNFTADVCHIFLSAMTLLRRCRVNAALTIQIFSQLFHYISAFIFNKFINPQNAQNCTRQWASRIYRRLGRLSSWAEKQGLEHAAETHLALINQVSDCVVRFFICWFHCIHIQIPPDLLRGSCITQYRCCFCKLGVPLRVLWGYSVATGCAIASVTLASEYPHSTLKGTST